MKTKFLLFASLIHFQFFAQQVPTVNSPGGVGPSGQDNAQFWSRAGNSQAAGINNIFGTRWNSGIYTITDNQNRMKLNGSVNYPVNGFAGQRDGYLLLGYSQNYATSLFTGATSGAYSQLHLNGPNGSFVQNGGYRPWMETGVTFTDNDDLSYFGLRKVGPGKDNTETILSWSDNSSAPSGPDDLVLRFTAAGGNPAIDAADLATPFDVDGLHVARFTGEGDFGLGNTFGIDNPIYVEPQSLAHYSLSNLQSVWQQYTNRNIAVGTGTSETANDGLRIGILGNNDANANGTAAIYNQELKPILLSTNANSNAINPVSGATGERVRITSVNTPTNLPTGGMGIYTPGGSSTNFTRMSVSHNPSTPVTRPLSLLHLGYNSTTTTTTTDGWRPWMDVGMFVSNKSDNVYLGLKNETTSILVDRQDAVLGWGDNPTTAGGNGPDNLRFIFTSASTSVQTPASNANTLNGLEVARMEPTAASTLSGNYGMTGIGDFSPAGPNTANPVDAKLDIDGDLRIRTVTSDNNLTQVLVVDPTDLNRVHYRNIPSNLGTGQGFVTCIDMSPAAYLSSDSKINLNDQNIYFENNNTLGQNHVGIGYNCSSTLRGKLSVLQDHPLSVNQSTIGISGVNKDISSTLGTVYTGVEGIANGKQTLQKVINRGGYFSAFNSPDTRGIVVEVPSSSNNLSSAIGGEFLVSAISDDNRGISAFVTGNGGNINNKNTGVFGYAQNSGFSNVGGVFISNSSNNSNAIATGVSGNASGSKVSNVGGTFTVNPDYNAVNIASSGRIYSPVNITTYPSIVAIGVYGYANSNPISEYAGFFDGDVWINGPATATGFAATTSDENFKKEINDITNANDLLMQLNPKSFYFDTLNQYGFNFSNRKQYGLIAQQVETILPELVSDKLKPATVDSTGAIVNPSVNYKTLNYDAFISILIKGHQEQNAIISHQDSMINELNNRLSNLENCINSLNLCNQNQPTQMAQPTTGQTISLNTVQSIVLNQNVPNPFAEQTVISYSIPESVKKADILFYDSNGKLINSIFIKERGNSQLNVFANDLSTGIYTYTLVADGQIVASKKMVKQ